MKASDEAGLFALAEWIVMKQDVKMICQGCGKEFERDELDPCIAPVCAKCEKKLRAETKRAILARMSKPATRAAMMDFKPRLLPDDRLLKKSVTFDAAAYLALRIGSWLGLAGVWAIACAFAISLIIGQPLANGEPTLLAFSALGGVACIILAGFFGLLFKILQKLSDRAYLKFSFSREKAEKENESNERDE